MFADGFETTGPVLHAPEKISEEINRLFSALKSAGKDQDWRRAIQLLEDFPPIDKVNSAEQAILQEALRRLRAIAISQDKKNGTFSDDSLADLSDLFHDLLSLKEKEFSL
jgi:geranylgeranyl pyrophosphate synthase